VFCSKCGTENLGTAKFCVKCGNGLGVATTPVMPVQNPQPEMPAINNQINTSPPPNNPVVSSLPVEKPLSAEIPNQASPVKQTLPEINYLMFIVAVLMKPVTTIKTEIHKFSHVKVAIIFTTMIAGVITLISLVKTMFSAVYVHTPKTWLTEESTQWVWSNLKNLKYFEIIFKTFLILIGILAVVALVYFLAGLIIKKTVSYTRLLGIITISIIPIALSTLVLSPLFGMLWVHLGVVVGILGFVYTLILLLDGVNRELTLEENDTKVYVHVICLALLLCLGYFTIIQMLSSSLGSLLSLFG